VSGGDLPRVEDPEALRAALEDRGAARAPALSRERYEALAASLGPVLQRERVALREGAHAYLARPGPVPLHTDHADVVQVAWWCEAADAEDGANRLLDAAPVVAALPATLRDRLRGVALECPPIPTAVEADPGAGAGAGRRAPAGRSPMASRLVLRPRPGRPDALFCSPWLRAVGAGPEDQAALDALRDRLRAAIARAAVRVRLAPGEALFVDNRRVLHGRDAIAPDSPRCLHRLWIGPA
jgi:alpha-ketoglutarate-dependent taurine dioxygenase